MKSKELALYRDLLSEIKTRVRQAQHRAALSANAEIILLYWDIGRIIAERQELEGWGASVVPRLAADLKNELPEEKGFSETNLKRMVQFSREYPGLFAIGARPVAQLSWGHNILLIQKLKDLPTRLWYARQTLEQGWSRDAMAIQIKNRAHERQGAAVTNFATTLPDAHASHAQGLLKDPYLFDFFTMEEPFHERELEIGLVRHIEKFLLELGRGFAFVGRQYLIEVSDREFYLDLLFYHLYGDSFCLTRKRKIYITH